jgi:YlmC/YmxH family sporulation protein
MRGSELQGKEVIELTTGARLGLLKESELLLDLSAGRVEGVVLRQPSFGGLRKTERVIPWSQIRKISAELIIVEATENHPTDEKCEVKSVM